MASVLRRQWWARGPSGHRVKRVSYGYALRINGRQVKQFNARWSREDAQNALAEQLLGIEPAAASTPPATARTFAQVAEQYLVVKTGKRSLRDDRLGLARVLRWFGPETPITEITAARVAEYQADRKAKGSVRKRDAAGGPRPLAPATVNRELALLRHLLVLAEEWGDIPKVPRVRLDREPEGRLRYLSAEEIARLLAACARSQNPHLAAIVTVAIYTGMRRGEILALVWERVDFARGVLQLEITKGRRRREVPMADAVYRVLSALPGPKASGPVFRRADGARWGNIRTAFDQACVRARLPKVRFHDLRHTAASHLVMRGASLADVKAILGHQDIKTTMRYSHLSPEHLRAAIARLDGLTPGGSAADVDAIPADLFPKCSHSGRIEDAATRK